MVGVYAIISPSRKVYVGQSWDIKKRHYYYTNHHNCREQVGLSRSIKKYGWNNHSVKILVELPKDVAQTVLDEHEIFCIEQFKEAGEILLNMKAGGMGGRLCDESIEKIKRNRPKDFKPTLGKKFSEESRKRMSQWQIGRKMQPEAIEKSKLANIGRKASEETKARLRAARALNNIWIGRRHSDESKAKQSAAKIGNKINNKKVKRIDTGEVFDSLSDAANSIGVQMKTLSARICKGSKVQPQFTYDV